MIPIRQVVSGFDTTFTDDVIVRQDRRRTVTIFADARSENSSSVFARVRPQVDAALDLSLGYSCSTPSSSRCARLRRPDLPSASAGRLA